MSKDLESLSIDELLEQIENSQSVEETAGNVKYNKDAEVKEFLKEFNIIPGLVKIPLYVIYYHYKRKWALHKSHKLTKIGFSRVMSQMFDKERNTKTRYYLINEDSLLDLSERNLQKAKDSDKLYENKIKKRREEEKK